MALPFYFVAASQNGVTTVDVGLLLGAQTIGSLASNPFWGRIGDKTGKLRLLQIVAIVRIIPPLLVLAFLAVDAGLLAFAVFFCGRGDDERRDHRLPRLPDGDFS